MRKEDFKIEKEGKVVSDIEAWSRALRSSMTENSFRYLILPDEVAPEPSREELFDRHSQLLDEMKETFRTKNNAYGSSFDKSLDKAGVISGWSRLSDKFNRFESYVFDNKFQEDDESVLDTLLDLSNYAIMMYMWIDRQEKWKRESSQEVDYFTVGGEQY